jgi:hypothetical protein
MDESALEKTRFEEFAQPSEWRNTDEGWQRKPLNGITVDVLIRGNGRYQVIVDRDSVSRVGCRYFEQKLCRNRTEIMQYAWGCFEPLANTPPPDPAPPKA